MSVKTELTREDIMPMEEYAKVRKERRSAIVVVKRNRRMEIGPVAVCHFESYDSMWQQVHEMLFIERGGEEQIADELNAYNPMIPKGSELVCTVNVRNRRADPPQELPLQTRRASRRR